MDSVGGGDALEPSARGLAHTHGPPTRRAGRVRRRRELDGEGTVLCEGSGMHGRGDGAVTSSEGSAHEIGVRTAEMASAARTEQRAARACPGEDDEVGTRGRARSASVWETDISWRVWRRERASSCLALLRRLSSPHHAAVGPCARLSARRRVQRALHVAVRVDDAGLERRRLPAQRARRYVRPRRHRLPVFDADHTR